MRASTYPDDQALVAAAATGEPGAARVLHDRYAPVVWAVTNRMAPDLSTAEDWAQEAWLRIFRALPRYRGDARFSTWVHRVAVNAALQQIRSGRTRREREQEAARPEVAVTRTTPALRVALDNAIGALPPRMRQILLLHDVEGYQHNEVAAILGIAEGTSKSQLARARAKVRDWMSEDGEATIPEPSASQGASTRRARSWPPTSSARSLAWDAA